MAEPKDDPDVAHFMDKVKLSRSVHWPSDYAPRVFQKHESQRDTHTPPVFLNSVFYGPWLMLLRPPLSADSKPPWKQLLGRGEPLVVNRKGRACLDSMG